MYIKTLVISNIAETFYRTYRKSNPKEASKRLEYDFLESERAMLYTGDNKIVITSTPVDHVYLKDLNSLLGYKNLINLYPQKPTERLCKDVTSNKTLFSFLVEQILNNPGVTIIPYFATEEFFDLLAIFKQKRLKFTTPETVSAKNRFIRNHYNCKVGFRKLWEKTTSEDSFVKIPKGFIVDDLPEAIDAAWWFYQQNTNFVVKYNRGTSGLGILFYRCQDLPNEERLFRRFLRKKHTDRIWFEENFVVEEFIDVDTSFYGGSPSIEFKVNNDVRHLYNCFQRLGKNAYFEGIMIAKEIEEQSQVDFNRVALNCIDFGKNLADLDYKGIFDVDLVVDQKHNIYAVEANLRRTGGTHVWETARILFGRNFMDKTVVISRDNLPVSKKIRNYQQLKERVEHLFFSKEKKEGIIPTIPSFINIGKIGFVAFGKTVERARQIEKELIEALS